MEKFPETERQSENNLESLEQAFKELPQTPWGNIEWPENITKSERVALVEKGVVPVPGIHISSGIGNLKNNAPVFIDFPVTWGGFNIKNSVKEMNDRVRKWTGFNPKDEVPVPNVMLAHLGSEVFIGSTYDDNGQERQGKGNGDYYNCRLTATVDGWKRTEELIGKEAFEAREELLDYLNSGFFSPYDRNKKVRDGWLLVRREFIPEVNLTGSDHPLPEQEERGINLPEHNKKVGILGSSNHAALLREEEIVGFEVYCANYNGSSDWFVPLNIPDGNKLVELWNKSKY